MVVTLDEAERLAGAEVYDSKGELIGTVRGPHVLDGELVGVFVSLDDAFAGLPNVGRDEVEVSPDYVEMSGDRSVRLRMQLMDAIENRRPPLGEGGERRETARVLDERNVTERGP